MVRRADAWLVRLVLVKGREMLMFEARSRRSLAQARDSLHLYPITVPLPSVGRCERLFYITTILRIVGIQDNQLWTHTSANLRYHTLISANRSSNNL